MNEHELQQKIHILEFHQKLLIKLISNPKLELYKLFIENGITEQEVERFFLLCETMSIKMEEQKAEGYVYFQPLFHELSVSLPSTLDIIDVINACLIQREYLPLFQELEKYL
jgi:hypothetical protein